MFKTECFGFQCIYIHSDDNAKVSDFMIQIFFGPCCPDAWVHQPIRLDQAFPIQRDLRKEKDKYNKIYLHSQKKDEYNNLQWEWTEQN